MFHICVLAIAGKISGFFGGGGETADGSDSAATKGAEEEKAKVC